jgi:hypothetical protein
MSDIGPKPSRNPDTPGRKHSQRSIDLEEDVVRRTRRIVSTVALAAGLCLSLVTPSAGTPVGPLRLGDPAGCQASERDLSAALGIAVRVCPDVPSSPDSSGPSARARTADERAPSDPCLPAPVDHCEAWLSTPYDGGAQGIDRVGDYLLSDNPMALTPNGAILVTAGNTDRVGPHYTQGPIAILGFDAASGNRLWASRYEGPSDYPFADAQSVVANDDTAFVTGYVHDGGIGVGVTLAYDVRTGAPRWQADFPGVALDSALSPDGSRVFVVGEQEVNPDDGPPVIEATTVAYDSTTGTPVWTRSLSDPDGMSLSGWRVAAAPGKVTVVAARLNDKGNTIGLVVATFTNSSSAAGGLISRISVPVPASNPPAGLALNADGSRAFVVQDRFSTLFSPPQTFTAAFDTVSGTMLWSAAYSGDDVESYATLSFFHPIDVSPTGDTVYVATRVQSDVTKTEGIATVAYQAQDGLQQWAVTEENPSDIRCVWACGPLLSVNPRTGQIVVAGAFQLGDRFKASTWSYAPDGTLQWRRMAGQLPVGATVPVGQATESLWGSIQHSPDGRHVYVGGSAWAIVNDPSSSEDVVVAAFDTTPT